VARVRISRRLEETLFRIETRSSPRAWAGVIRSAELFEAKSLIQRIQFEESQINGHVNTMSVVVVIQERDELHDFFFL
jgi:hypothetical protein